MKIAEHLEVIALGKMRESFLVEEHCWWISRAFGALNDLNELHPKVQSAAAAFDLAEQQAKCFKGWILQGHLHRRKSHLENINFVKIDTRCKVLDTTGHGCHLRSAD